MGLRVPLLFGACWVLLVEAQDGVNQAPHASELIQDDECAAGDAEACSLHALQRRAASREVRAGAGGAAGRGAAAQEPPELRPNATQAVADAAKADGALGVDAALGAEGGYPPVYCMYTPWLCPSQNQQPQPSHWQPPWMPPWMPQPAPAPAPGGGQSHQPSYNPAMGICAVLPWMCPAPSPSARPEPAPAPSRPPAPPPTSLERPSSGQLHTFYMYRVQSDDNYPQPNHNMLNLPGGMWYLHNEVVWHEKGRSGTYFKNPVTRILKFKVQMRPTQPLVDMGMNFGVLNTFDSGMCSGPWGCDNFAKAGYTIGCETWKPGAPSNFPHAQWNKLNHYQGATWYSVPGPCPSEKYTSKSKACSSAAPGGECPPGQSPTGARDCTYTLEQVGQITINELEGIDDFDAFIKAGGREYNPKTDKGVHMTFWDGLTDDKACAARVARAEQLFRQKYPDQPELEAPPCDFNRFKFYPDRNT